MACRGEEPAAWSDEDVRGSGHSVDEVAEPSGSRTAVGADEGAEAPPLSRDVLVLVDRPDGTLEADSTANWLFAIGVHPPGRRHLVLSLPRPHGIMGV